MKASLVFCEIIEDIRPSDAIPSDDRETEAADLRMISAHPGAQSAFEFRSGNIESSAIHSHPGAYAVRCSPPTRACTCRARYRSGSPFSCALCRRNRSRPPDIPTSDKCCPADRCRAPRALPCRRWRSRSSSTKGRFSPSLLIVSS